MDRSKLYKIFLNALPILAMLGCIPFVSNDYLLTVIYISIIVLALRVKRTENDLLILTCGFFIMTASEYLFLSTGVETFNRHTLFGMMPLWLPFLWAYGFVAIARSVEILRMS